MNDKFEELIESYITHKVGLSNLFLTSELAGLLQGHITRLNLNGEMKHAGTGNDQQLQHDKNVRSDKIYWIDKKSKQQNELGFLDYIEDFIESPDGRRGDFIKTEGYIVPVSARRKPEFDELILLVRELKKRTTTNIQPS